jgi:hypothetical protein
MSEPPPRQTPAAAGGEQRTWSLLLGLEREARRAETAAQLAYTIVNQTRRLIAYRQAVLVRRPARGKIKIEAVSNVATVERNAPYIVWTRAVLRALDRAGRLGAAGSLAPSDLPDALAADWGEWWPAQVLWIPFAGAGDPVGGGLLLMREAPSWSEAERVLTDQLADAYGHAWRALGGLGRARAGGTTKRAAAALVLAAAAAGLMVPVRQSAIAPAQVAPRDPQVVSAPIDGVVREVFVTPNEAVTAGTLLFAFEPAELEANREVAARALAVAEAELQRAESQAFGDPRSKGEVALKRAEAALKRVELDYAQSLLERVEVRAPSDGVAVFADANEFRGRPVRTGERVMAIADPARARIAIELPVADAIALTPGSEVRLFLDTAPLDPVPARLERASFEASETADGVLAYRVSASFADDVAPPRLGLRGSAKLYGERAPLALYLFRRPLAAARQFFGF